MSKKFKDMTDTELQGIAQDCHAAVQSDCFSASDVLNEEAACCELERRGYEINEMGTTELDFERDDEEN